MTTKKQATIWTVIIGILLFGGLGFFFDDYLRPPFGGKLIKEPIAEELKLKAPVEKILNSKEVDWIEEVKDKDGKPTGETINHGKIIKYDYVSDVEVATSTITIKDGKREKVITEKVEKRTGNAKFFETGNIIDGKKETIGHFYGGTPFVKQDDKWFQTEIATTSIDAFEEQTKPDLVSRIKGLFTAQADELTPVYTGAGDGILKQWTGSWQDCHDISNSEIVDYTSTFNQSPESHSNPRITRTSLPFNTSDLPTGAIVSAADLKITSDSYFYDTGGNSLVVIWHTRASDTTLTSADYNITNFGSTEYISRLDLGSWNTSALNTIALNTAGKLAIVDDGYTLFGILISEDLDDDGGGSLNAVSIRMSEYAGTASDPYLSVTYTEGNTCTPTIDGVWKMDLQDHCTTTESTYSDYGMECYNPVGGSWVIGANTEVRRGSSTNCLPQIEGTGVFSIQPIH